MDYQRFWRTLKGWLPQNLKNKFVLGLWSAGLMFLLAVLSLSCQSVTPSDSTVETGSVPTLTLPDPQTKVENAANPAATALPTETSTADRINSGQSMENALSLDQTPAPPVSYTIQASYDYISQIIQIEQTITYQIQSAHQSDLVLINEPQRLADEFILSNLLVNGEKWDQVSIEQGWLVVGFPAGLSIGDWLLIKLDYAYRLPLRAARLGYTPYQVNFGDWYLIVPPYSEQTGWLAYPAAGVGEHINYELASFDVSIQLLNPPAGLVVAASLPAEEAGNAYRFATPYARSFAWSASPYYRSAEKKIGGTQVTSYYFSNHESAGEAALQSAGEALETYTNLLGIIDLPSLAIVESQFPDGMEYQGLFFLGMEYYHEYDATLQNYLVTIAVHETAHQWFYAVVANDQAIEPWVDEVLCTYLELLYYEQLYPDLVSWWWQYRVHRFDPQGWVNSTIYDHDHFRSYVDAVYLRGVLWLEEIRLQMGRDQFSSALRSYFTTNQYQMVRGTDLLTALGIPVSNTQDEHLNSYFLIRDQ